MASIRRLVMAVSLLAVLAAGCERAPTSQDASQPKAESNVPLAATSSADSYELKGGFPTAQAAQRSIDDVDLSRAIVAYRFFYPTVSMEATFWGTRNAGALDNKGALVLAGAPRHVLFTGNSDIGQPSATTSRQSTIALVCTFTGKIPTLAYFAVAELTS